MDSHFREKNREVLLGNLKREFGHLQDRNKDNAKSHSADRITGAEMDPDIIKALNLFSDGDSEGAAALLEGPINDLLAESKSLHRSFRGFLLRSFLAGSVLDADDLEAWIQDEWNEDEMAAAERLADVLGWLGRLYRIMDNNRKCEECLLESIMLISRLASDTDIENQWISHELTLADTYYILGFLYAESGEKEKALAMFKSSYSAIRILADTAGIPAVLRDAAVICFNLAEVFRYGIPDYESKLEKRCESFYVEALEFIRWANDAAGDDKYMEELRELRSGLCYYYASEGRLEEAAALYNELLDYLRGHIASDYHVKAASEAARFCQYAANQYIRLSKSGKYDRQTNREYYEYQDDMLYKAEKLCVETIKVLEDLNDSSDSDEDALALAMVISKLAEIRNLRKDPEDAIDLCEQAAGIFDSLIGKGTEYDLQAALNCRNYASAYLANQEYSEAADQEQEYLELIREIAETDENYDQLLADTYCNVGDFYNALPLNTDKEIARSYYMQALDLLYKLEVRILSCSYDDVVKLYDGTLWTDYSSGKYDADILDLKSRI